MIRQSIRDNGVVLMGKNTMVRRALRSMIADFPEYEKVLPYVKGNVGFVFTNGDLKEVRETIVSNVVAAPARAGALAPVDVYVPAGNTGMEPGKTSFFQALGIPTKIARGTIEIVNDVQVVAAGSKVGSSEAMLLNMLNISPFTYGMTVVAVYDDGSIFAPSVLDIEEKSLLDTFQSQIKTIAAISLATGIPTLASVTHSVVNAYKDLLAISVATDYTFEASQKVSVLFRFPFALIGCPNILLKISYRTAGPASPQSSTRGDEYSICIHTLITNLNRIPLVPLGLSADKTDQGVPREPRGLRRRCRPRGRRRRR